MKKVFFSLAAVVCFAVSASAQQEVHGAVNNNSAPTDENVHGQTRMDMRSGMNNVLRTQTQEGAQTDPQLNSSQPQAQGTVNTTQTTRPNDADVNVNQTPVQSGAGNGNTGKIHKMPADVKKR